MIFRTIKDDISGAIKSIGIFGLSLNDIKTRLYDIQSVGFKNAIFNTSKIDVQAIVKYNSEIAKGTEFQQALAIASRNTK